MAERRLGRGLDFFLSGSPEAEPAVSEGEVVRSIPVDQLVPNPHQPRRDFHDAELQELAASIREAGILQPVLARQVGEHFQIVAGERRWRAAKLAGLDELPVLLRDISDEQSAIFGLVENLHREDLNPIEKAHAFKRLQGLAKASQEEVAKQVGLERSTVANFVRLLELPGEVQAYVSRGTLSMGHARALLAAPTNALRKQLAEQVIRDRLSVRATEALAQSMKEPSPSPSGGGAKGGGKSTDAKGRPLWLKEIEENLGASLQTDVEVRYGKKRSRILIDCHGRDEFERLYELLKGLGESA